MTLNRDSEPAAPSGASRRSSRAASIVAGALLSAALGAGPLAAQVPSPLPQRPSGVTDQQMQQAIQQRGLGDQIRQRIQESGMTPDQVRARLRSAGYPENLVDQYLGPTTPGQASPPPSLDVLRAASLLGLGDFAVSADSLLRRESVAFSRSDTLLLDSLGFQVGTDSIPTRRDSLGVVRLDSAAVVRLAEQLRRPHLFGLDVFRRVTTQFNPLASGPVDQDYRLGPGDELVLIVTGGVEVAYQLPVTRDGFVVIPQVGQLYVANLTLTALTDVLYGRLGQVYSGVRRGPDARTRFHVSVSRIRTIQIYVTGEVARPGAYSASALATVMHALYQAGGPSERGDFRAVRVLRGGRAVQTVDLYDYLLFGNTRDDIRLEQGDVVFIPPRSRRVSITGNVGRPALYDLAAGQGLRELIQMAGGLLPDAYTGRVQVERILPPERREAGGRDRTVLDVDLGEVVGRDAPPVSLEPDDKVTVFAVTRPVRNLVTIRGDVWHPGVYELQPGMLVSGLVAAAGGLKPDAYAERAHIVRLEADSTRRLVAVDLRAAVDSLRDRGTPTTADLALREFDELTVYSRTSFRPARQIAIYGAVQRPGVYDFRDSMHLRDVVMIAGGLRDEAYLLEAEISRLPESGRGPAVLTTVLKVPLDSSYVLDPSGYLRRETSARADEPVLQPYDNVFIRRVPGWEFQRNVVLSGQVRFPGRYSLARRDERLQDLIVRAGGLTDNAYVRGAVFVRTEGHAGRIGIDLERVQREPSFRDNIVLVAGDSLYLPEYQPIVTVDGAVNSPVAVAYVPGSGTRYYINRAGGYSRWADKGHTYVTQPNGSVWRASARPEPGARIVVPEIPPSERRQTDWGQVLSSAASVLTSALTIILVVQRL